MILSLGVTPKNYAPLGAAAANDADAQAFIDAAGITDATQKSAVNQLVLDLKSYNIWTKMKALYPALGGTASTHKWNLKDPRDLDAAFRLTFSTGWTHSSDGMTPNGTSAYANTFLIPNTHLTNNDSHISVYLKTNSDNNGVDIGIQDDMGTGVVQSTYYIRTKNSNNLTATIQTTDLNRISGSNTDSRGFYITSRTSSIILKQYKNSSIFGTNTNTSTGTRARYSIPLSTLRYINDAGSNIYTSYSNRELAFASIGDGLTDTEAANFYTAVQTYQTTLGRQV
jgi:hypothetical protein